MEAWAQWCPQHLVEGEGGGEKRGYIFAIAKVFSLKTPCNFEYFHLIPQWRLNNIHSSKKNTNKCWCFPQSEKNSCKSDLFSRNSGKFKKISPVKNDILAHCGRLWLTNQYKIFHIFRLQMRNFLLLFIFGIVESKDGKMVVSVQAQRQNYLHTDDVRALEN